MSSWIVLTFTTPTPNAGAGAAEQASRRGSHSPKRDHVLGGPWQADGAQTYRRNEAFAGGADDADYNYHDTVQNDVDYHEVVQPAGVDYLAPVQRNPNYVEGSSHVYEDIGVGTTPQPGACHGRERACACGGAADSGLDAPW